MKTRKRYSTWMKICSRLFVILPLLAPTLAAADDSCGDFKRALEALDASRSVRKYVFTFTTLDTAQDTLQMIQREFESKGEIIRLYKNFRADVDTAYYAAYSDYGNANIFTYDAALHAASSAGISNDKSIQSVITLGGTTLRMISALVPSDDETIIQNDSENGISPKEIREREENLDTQDSKFSSFLGIIWNAACSGVSSVKSQAPSAQLPAPDLYWVDEAGQKIQRMIGEDDDQTVQDLASSANRLMMPGSIAVDPLDGKMYWTDDGDGDPKTLDGAIRRANLDGSGPAQDVKVGLADPVGIALDLNAGYLYWADREQGIIYRGKLADIDKAGSLKTPAETLVFNLDKPYQIALDTANGHVYWTERGGSKIRRVALADLPDLDGDDVTELNYSLAAPRNPYGLALDPLAGKMYWTERGTGLNGGDQIRRADLNGQNGEVLVNSAPYSLSGITLDPATDKLYWTDETSGSIWRLDPSVRNAMPEEVVTGLTAPEGIVMAAASHPDWLPLVALYRATDGKNWATNDAWLSDAPLGEWYCLDTDDDGRVTELLLSGNGLSGPIPSKLGDLSELTVLDLRRNDLTGGIPTKLGKLKNLTILSLAANRLGTPTGALSRYVPKEIPADLGLLRALKVLDLSDNGFGGTMPKDFGKGLRSLEELDLGHNFLTGEIPQDIGYLGYLTSLVKLRLNNNGFTGQLPPGLGKLNNLTELDLGHNELDGNIPAAMGNLSNLEILDLGGNELVGEVPESLDRLPLIAVDLYYNKFEGCIPRNLAAAGAEPGRSGLPSRCRDEELDDMVLGVLAGLYLRTDGSNWFNKTRRWFDGHDDDDYENWHGVHTNDEGSIIGLDLSHNNLNGAIEPLLAELPDLRWLRLYGNPLKGCIPIDLKDKLLADEYVQEAKATPDEGGGLLKEFTGAPDWIKSVVMVGVQSALETAGRKTAAKWFPVGMTSTEGGLELLGEAIYNYNLGQLGLPLCATPAPSLPLSLLPQFPQTFETDKQALLDIRDYYVARDNNNADRFPNWADNNKPIGEWPGVQSRTINGEDRVTRLSLDKRGLIGSIPGAFLAKLGELRFLNLSRNKLTGPIPPELGHLVNLHTLALNDNQLENHGGNSPIPKELSNLARLEEFYLQNNQLAGVIPQELAILSHSLRIMNIDREGERFLSGCLPPKDWGAGLDIKNAILSGGDVVTWTLLSGGIHGLTRTGAQKATKAGKVGVKISVAAGVKAFAPALSSELNIAIKAGIKANFPGMSSAATKILADNIEQEVINQTVKYAAVNYTDGTFAELVSGVFEPVSKLSDEVAEIFGSLGEYFGWYRLGGKVEMDKVYCPG